MLCIGGLASALFIMTPIKMVYADDGSDADGDGYTLEESDCNDSDASINPGAVEGTESCDGKDNDCDGEVDEGEQCFTPTIDTDRDGYTIVQGDCNDSDATIHPGATETCDGKDNDCNLQVDEGLRSLFYQDGDNDGYGNIAKSTKVCSAPAGYVANHEDCNDNDKNVNPDATEVCDGTDNNCNAQIDEECPAPSPDADKDGVTVEAGDCNDSDSHVYPGASEICDGLDNNCDGAADDGLTMETYYADFDGDGYGDAAETVRTCEQPARYVTDNTDCDDTTDAAYPGAVEVCDDRIDNNCDGDSNEGCPEDSGDPLDDGTNDTPRPGISADIDTGSGGCSLAMAKM